MKSSELEYTLPETLIAQRPIEPRDAARMLVVDRGGEGFAEDTFANLPKYLRAGDCVVLNDTRVIRARLLGQKATGGRVEIFLLREESPTSWVALVRPSAKVKPGTRVAVGARSVIVEEVLDEGRRRVRFETPDVLEFLEAEGIIPLPPYIHRDTPEAGDLRRYQTVYADRPGAVAAPTAGLHYTDQVFDALQAKGVGVARLTLHVGYGTFKPLTAETLEDHYVDPEWFEFPEATAAQLNAAREAGGRVVSVGTTSTRVLETQCRSGRFEAGNGWTDTYIYPPYEFRGVDALQTNFHLPKSSLLALVCAFAGTERTLAAYRHAVAERYRFYSYGDVMLIV